MTSIRIRLLLVILFSSAAVSGQTVPPQKVEFEVASVRFNDSGSGNSRSSTRNGLYDTENVPLRQIVVRAFDAKDYQVFAPDWLNSDRYDIRAKVPEGAPDTQIPAMIHTLLVDRFKMKFHRETREMPIYALLVSKGGPKFSAAKEETATSASSSSSAPPAPASPATVAGAGVSNGSSGAAPAGARLSTMSSTGTLAQFAVSLSRNVDRPVIDMTGLEGRYDMRLKYSPQSASADSDPAGPSIFTALTEQLGLRLDARKGPIEVIVIDNIERVREP